MTKQQFSKIRKVINTLINKLEKDSLNKGIDISSEDFQNKINILKTKFLEEKGLSLEEYEELSQQLQDEKNKLNTNVLVNKDEVDVEIQKLIEELQTTVKQKITELSSTTQEELSSLKGRLQKVENKKPDIINKIIKEIVKEKPITNIIQTKEIIKELDLIPLDELKQDIFLLQETYQDNLKQIQDISDALTQYKDLPKNFELLSADTTWALNKLKRHTLAGAEWDYAVSDQRYYTKGQINNLNPMTTLGDIIFENATPTPDRLAGNTTTTKKYLQSVGVGGVAQAPSWQQIAYADVSGTPSLTGYEVTSNKVTSISGSSTDTQYPSAKLLYDQLAGKQPTGSYLTDYTIDAAHLSAFWTGASGLLRKVAGTPATYDLDTSTYLTSLSGAVLTSQATHQTIGDTTDRLSKLWATDITVSNAISGSVTGASTSCSGNAATVTNGLYTTDIGSAVQAYNSNLTTWAGKTVPSGTVVGISDTQTLTNKRITPRISTLASYTTDTGSSINGDTQDMFIVTAQAGALKFMNPSGTPTDGQKLIISVASSTTATRALTWDTAYGATTVALPSTTTATTATLTIGFIWSASKSLWQIVGVA